MSSVRVWDLFVRLFHWSTAILFLSNYWLTEEGGRTHRYIGYTLIGLVLARIIWGFIGTTYARFSSFVPTPTTLFGYLRAVRNGKHPYYLSHNPLGALMVLFLLVMLLATGSSGWLLTTDTFEAEPWLEELHELSANLVMFAVGVHIAAVIWVTHTARERLVPAMWDGMKPEKPCHRPSLKNVFVLLPPLALLSTTTVESKKYLKGIPQPVRGALFCSYSHMVESPMR